jgi:hypothetical protein
VAVALAVGSCIEAAAAYCAGEEDGVWCWCQPRAAAPEAAEAEAAAAAARAAADGCAALALPALGLAAGV